MKNLFRSKLITILVLGILAVFLIAASDDCEVSTDSSDGSTSEGTAGSQYAITEVIPGLMKITVTEPVTLEDGSVGAGDAFDLALQELAQTYWISINNKIEIDYARGSASWTKVLMVQVLPRQADSASASVP